MYVASTSQVISCVCDDSMCLGIAWLFACGFVIVYMFLGAQVYKD